MDETILNGVFWNHLVYPELATNEVDDPAAILPWLQERLGGAGWPEFVVCLSIAGLDAVDYDERRMTVSRIRSVLSDVLSPSQRMVTGFAHTNSLYFCGTLEVSRDELLESLNGLNRRLSDEMGLANSIGLAFVDEPTLSSLQWATQNAIVAQRQRIRTGTNGVFVLDSKDFQPTLDQKAYWALVQRLHATVRGGDIDAVEGLLGEFDGVLFRQSSLALQHLRPVLQSLIVFMQQAATDAFVEPVAVAEKSQSYLWRMGATYDYGRLREVFADAAVAFTGMVYDRYHSLRHRLAAGVDDCIRTGYSDPELSLHQIAQTLAASPSHLSRTYKKVKGIGVTRAINQQRIEKARLMLLDRDKSVTDIALDSGFTSLQHFGRVFRELTGETPSGFRRARIG